MPLFIILMDNQADSQEFHVGQNLDVLDSVNKWMNAEVLFAGNNTIYVHYSGWSAKYDESISVHSPRILTQWEQGKPICLNNRIDAYHPIGGWLEARVIEIGESTSDSQPVKVHFLNYDKKYDIWVNLKNNDEVALIGSRSKAYGIGKKRCKKIQNKMSELIKKILEEKAKNLQADLQTRNLVIKKSGGDGNCLFRSVSHQLYGTEEHFAEIRKVCMDYISFEKNFFQDYVAQDIDDYIEMKRKDGEWGDDIEIQAVSEIYARPIEIYVFGDKPIRTFHEENENKIQPMRLAYVGACHYDSIKSIDHIDDGLMETKFGQFEDLFFSTYKQQMAAIIRNRNVFSQCNRLEDTVGEHLEAENRNQTKIEDELEKALEMSETEAILEQIENAELKQFQNKYELEKIQEDLKKIEEKEIEEAKKLSEKSAPQRPYWFGDILAQGFSEPQIWFAIEVKGFDPDAVQNFLLDNL